MSKGLVLDLNEIIDISEDGASVRCPSALELNQEYVMCLDLAEARTQIYTTGQVMWSEASGRVGLRFVHLPGVVLTPIADWLFVNALASAVNAEVVTAPRLAVPGPSDPAQSALLPDYTNTLATLSAVQREVESLGTDLDRSLRLIAIRSQALVRATGAAIAMAGPDPESWSAGQARGRMLHPWASNCTWDRAFQASAFAPEKPCIARTPRPTLASIKRAAGLSASAP